MPDKFFTICADCAAVSCLGPNTSMILFSSSTRLRSDLAARSTASPASPSAFTAIPLSKFLTAVSALAPRYSKMPSPPMPPTTRTKARTSYIFLDRRTHLRGVRTRVRVLTLWVGRRFRGWISSIIAPINRMTVDHIRPQKYPSAFLISNALATSSEETTTDLDYSDWDLPL